MGPASPADRDRDSQGRPRSARPRDALGRPLPHAAGSEPLGDAVATGPAEALTLGQQLLDDGQPFEAHELFESIWKATPPPQREVWRALAQLAVGITHALRGNSVGARALLIRAADNLAEFAGTTPAGIDVDGIRGWARSAAGDLALTAEPPRLVRGDPAGSGSEGARSGAVGE
jgi:uncharacterized protein